MTPCPTCGRSQAVTDDQITELVARLEVTVLDFGRRLGLPEREVCRRVNVADGRTR